MTLKERNQIIEKLKDSFQKFIPVVCITSDRSKPFSILVIGKSDLHCLEKISGLLKIDVNVSIYRKEEDNEIYEVY